MKATGVVRRIDDLGRIVIPKEIRKTLRITDGESVEIFLDNDNIILKKYYPLERIPSFYKKYADSIYSEIDCDIMIVDRDRIVVVSGDFKKKYLNCKISNVLEEIIKSKKNFVSKDINSICLSGNVSEKCSYIIAPIVSNCDAIGAVIIFSCIKKIDDFIIKIGSIAAKFFGKYVE